MPLSEHEQRLLEQMERALYAEDPKFASALRGSDLRGRYRRRALLGAFGVVVGPVKPGGPAEAAGLREGDVLIGIGSYTLQNLAQLQGVVAAKRPGDSIDLHVWRAGEEFDATIEFPPAEPEPAADTATPGASETAAPEAAAPDTAPEAG